MGDDTMPVFKPMRRRRMLLGLGLREWLRVAAALAAGAALAFALGGWRHEADVQLTATELQEEYSRLSVMQGALQKAERMAEASGAADEAALDLTAEERSLIGEARALGIGASMEREELAALIPPTERRVVPVIADIPRWMLCLGAPLVVTVLLNVEVAHNTTLAREAARFIAFRRGQREFSSMPRVYMRKGA